MATSYAELLKQYRAAKDPQRRKALKRKLDAAKNKTAAPAAPKPKPKPQPSTAHRYGMSWLGGARFPQVIKDNHPREFGAAFFWEVDGFGVADEEIEYLCSIGVPWLAIGLAWDDDHIFRPDLIPTIARRAEALARIIRRYPNTKFYVKPVVEHELTERQWLPFAEVVENALRGTSAEVVNSPNVNKGFVSKKYLNEYHGAEKRPRKGGRFAFDFDGTNMMDSDIEAYKKAYAGAEYFLLWIPQCNGNRKMGVKTDRKGRIHWPTDNHVDAMIAQIKDRGPVSLANGYLYKVMSDQQKAPPQGKDCKPVWISPPDKKHRVIEFRAQNGQVIDRAPYYGTFNDEKTKKILGYRYYHSDWGYKLAARAQRIQGGKSAVNVYADGKKIGSIHVAFRVGGFRG